MHQQARALVISACLSQAPLHAQINTTMANCTWTCDVGFYRTIDTCRMCSTYFYYYQNVARGYSTQDFLLCDKGQYLRDCTRDQDAKCVPCPQQWSLASGKIYTEQNNCEKTECRNGFLKNNTQSDCLPCAKGYYCLQGKAPQQCSAECTTLTPGASHILECKGHDMAAFSITHVLFLPPSLTFSLAAASCRTTLDPQVISWITYGTFLGCSVQFPNSPTIGVLQCDVAISSCVAGPYIEWLKTLFLARQTTIRTMLQMCLQRTDLIVGSMHIEPLLANANADKTSAATNQSMASPYMQTHETLYYEHQQGGTRRNEVANALGIVASACLALLCLLMATCGVMIWTRTRQRILSDFHHKMLERRKRRL